MLLIRRSRLRSSSAAASAAFSTSTARASASPPAGSSSDSPFGFAPVKTKTSAAARPAPQPSTSNWAQSLAGGGQGSAGWARPAGSSSASAWDRSAAGPSSRPAGGRSWDTSALPSRRESWGSPDRSVGSSGGGSSGSLTAPFARAPDVAQARVAAEQGEQQAHETLQARESSIKPLAPEVRQAPKRRIVPQPTSQDVATTRDVYLPFSLTVASLAKLVGRKLKRVQRVITQAGLPHNDAVHLLSAEDASLIVGEFGLNPIIDNERGFDIHPEPVPADNSHLPLRPPIVTIMGHVDHGKTTLLDTLRKASVAKGEAGGITQHIGAFSVALPPSSDAADNQPRTICFLDTPGHAAFTAMRARGAQVTDIVILVVAADDGVMPQTKEVINLVKDSEGVQLVVAINKVDKHGANVERVKNDLAAADVLLEDLGGEVPAVPVSGLTGKGLDELMETVSTLAEVAELRAETDGRAEGVVLESQVVTGRGMVATVLVTRGKLQVGSIIVAGQTWARVRTISDDKGKAIKACGPGTPVSITGWKEMPSAGEEVLETKDGEAAAIKAVANRVRQSQIHKDVGALDAINEQRRLAAAAHAEAVQKKLDIKAARHAAFMAGEKMPAAEWVVARNDLDAAAAADAADKCKELLLVVKGDVSGTVEAVVSTLATIGNKEARARIIRSGVGDIQPSDVDFAASAGAMVIGFSVKCAKPVATEASRSGVDIYLQGVIYRLIEEVTSRVASLLPPIIETRTVGEGAVSQLFTVSSGKGGGKPITVAGCRVNNGAFAKADQMRVVRGGNEVHQGPISSLKYLKDDVSEVRKGSDCGLQLAGFDDLRPGDVLQCVKLTEKKRSL